MGEDFPSKRLWLVVPFCSCTHRTELSNCSSEWGHCLSAAQAEELTLEKLDSALAYWVLVKEEANAAWTPVYVAPEFQFWLQ